MPAEKTAPATNAPILLAGKPVKTWKLFRPSTNQSWTGPILDLDQMVAALKLSPEDRVKIGLPFKVAPLDGSLPTSPVISGASVAAPVWGIESGVSGLLTGAATIRVTQKYQSQKDYMYDDNGFKLARVDFDFEANVNIEVVCGSTTLDPLPADRLTIAEKTFLVDDPQTVWEQRGWKKLTTPATLHPNITLT